MSHFIRSIAVVSAVLGSVGLAAAAGMTGMSLNLNPSQKQTISTDLKSEKTQSQPSNFHASVGAKVPGSLALKALPSNVSNRVPATKTYEFVKFQNNDILIVNPKNREVAEIITPSAMSK